MRRAGDLRKLAGRSHWREGDARRIVDAWRQSGEPVSRFAGRLGIDPRRVSRRRRWRRLPGASRDAAASH
jgi:hypothetical protein